MKQCQLDAIATLRTVKSIKNALQELPRGLNEIYENILKQISKTDAEVVRRILLWLSFTVLPLTLKELHTAAAVELSLDELDDEACLNSSEDILYMCGSLVSVSEQGHIRLAHLSVRDYLLSSEIRQSNSVSAFALTPLEANHELALNCLTYLSFGDLGSGPSPSSDDYADRLARHPLLKHAATAWPYYVRASNSSLHLEELILKFFSPQCREIFMSWVQVLNADFNFKWDLYPRHATSLYYASSFGLTKIVDALIREGLFSMLLVAVLEALHSTVRYFVITFL